MRTVAITGIRETTLVEVADPTPAKDYALVRVDVAPMCTEYKAYASGHITDRLGHEAAGTVVAAADGVPLRVGQRVVAMPQFPCLDCRLCRAGDTIHCEHNDDVSAVTGSVTGTATYAQYLLKKAPLLLRVPDDLSTEHAAMACCGLGPTFGAMRRMDVGPFDTVLVAGLGPVGCGAVINASIRGARVIAIESHPYRARLARELGADDVFDPSDPDALNRIREATGGGPDVAVDCSGAAAAQRLLIDAVRRRGQVAFVGEAGELSVHVSRDLIRKGLTLHGCWHWNLTGADRIFEVIRRAGPQIDRLITHRFPMSRVADAWELQLDGECGKVLLDPWA